MNVEIFECVLAPENGNTVIREVPLVSNQIWEMGKFHLERCGCKVHLCPQGQNTCSYLQEVRVGSQLNNSIPGASQVVLVIKILPALSASEIPLGCVLCSDKLVQSCLTLCDPMD